MPESLQCATANSIENQAKRKYVQKERENSEWNCSSNAWLSKGKFGLHNTVRPFQPDGAITVLYSCGNEDN